MWVGGMASELDAAGVGSSLWRGRGGAVCSAANLKSVGQPGVRRGRWGSLEVAGRSDLAGVNQDCRHFSARAVEQLGEIAWLFLHGH